MSILPQHPLVPLTAEEINAIALAVRASPKFPTSGEVGLYNTPVFARIQLKEPSKKRVLKFNQLNGNDPNPPPRKAIALVYEPVTNKTHKFTVKLIYNNIYTPNAVLVSADVQKHKVLDVIPAMDQYVLELNRQLPVHPLSGPQPPAQPYTGLTVTGLILEPGNEIGQKVLELLARRGISREDLSSGRVRPDYLGGFESFRKAEKCSECDKCCGELIPHCAVHHRFSTVFFRFFAGSSVFDQSREIQTPVNFTPGCDVTGPGVGKGYYDALGRLEGLLVQVDLTDRKLVDIIDFGFEVVPDVVPDKIYRPKHGWKTQVQPLYIIVPQRSFSYDANTGLILFDNWQMRLSWDFQCGIQLYNIAYSDTDIRCELGGAEVVRSILYKASCTEAIVSYTAGSPLFRRNFTSADTSFYPVLRRLIKLVKGQHVPENAILVSIPLNTRDGPFDASAGVNVNLVDVVGIFERDADLLTMATGNTGPTTRGRELVVRSIFSGLFYLWIFDYIFQQDGTIRCEVQVTGRLATSLRYGQPESPWGEYVSKNYLGILHNHIYAYRFDFDIDGQKNIVEMEEVIPANDVEVCQKFPQCCENILTRTDECDQELEVPDHIHGETDNHNGNAQKDYVKNYKNADKCKKKKCCEKEDDDETHDEHKDGKKKKSKCESVINPCGHAGFVKETHFHTELEAVTDVDYLRNRIWVVKNPQSQLRFKNTPRGYAIMPRQNGSNVAQDWSWMNSNLGYTKHNFFVTPYKKDEQYASGDFPILAGKDVGLGSWVKKNRKIENKDVVCWYVIAFAHSAHAEDWPYITLAPQGVNLVPHQFFEWNPATTMTQSINSNANCPPTPTP
jgi:Cu2+-containing amine oxidase